MTLRARLALTFFLTALLTGAAVAWFGVSIANRVLAEGEQALAENAGETALRLRTRRRETAVRAVHGVAALAVRQAGEDREPDTGLCLQAGELAGLDILQILDEDRRIRGSLHWPEQVGSRSTLVDLPAGVSGGPVEVSGPDSESRAFLAQAAVPHRTGDWLLVGGVYAAPDAQAAPAGPYLGIGQDLARPMLFAGLAFALVAGLIGILLARILTRPLNEMTRALDAVAAGDENHDYPQPRGDEFGPMVASFSRMRSSLDREQARLQAVERVAAWRETARRVAHEIKNPLVPIRLTMENLIKARSLGEQTFEPVFEDGARAVLEEVGRLGRIVDAFSAYAEMPAPRLQRSDLDRILEPVAALFAGDDRVRIVMDPGAAGAPVMADPDLLGQAFRNILSNCRDAMGGSGGEIRIRTGVEQGHATVDIADTGPGFRAEVLANLFEPYFTTRDEGTGLGMAITQRIVTEHGGAVTAANGARGGARFLVTVPLAADPE